MKRFLFRISLSGIPFLFLFLTYFILDPFRVLYNYEDYSKELFIQINRDFVSTETFLKNRSKYQFNSFIFGSSRTLAYKTWEWKKWLPDNAVPFSFDASNENIFGIWSKIKYINKLGDKINNAIIIICPDVTFDTNTDYDSYLYIKDYRVSGNGRIRFHLSFLKAFFTERYYWAYMDYFIFNEYRRYMNHYFTKPFRIKYDPIWNDTYLISFDKLLETDFNGYYLKYANYFIRDKIRCQPLQQLIDSNSLKMLHDIKDIFYRHKTNYKIIISPLLDQKQFNDEDLLILTEIFGAENIFDFSGVNNYTNDYHNYYENSHYRPTVGSKILKQVYAKNRTSIE